MTAWELRIGRYVVVMSRLVSCFLIAGFFPVPNVRLKKLPILCKLYYTSGIVSYDVSSVRGMHVLVSFPPVPIYSCLVT
ncbi:hypothetical protein F5Y00DRAFT_32825 [Daldinia vernicosa]|uniref:uncharacterized protein n=1 Tax=Daldinia vernicosa TaxID=114800 RepID=UPI002007E301|nr:uncharacterized protein F5Y00DRAFT_32825 [Daldinia vernicosa]KAI0850532.1 hypothetical protein F5Y00DRAFT_32825 [Daldinia vernicosa]